jgi:hypothetical protein
MVWLKPKRLFVALGIYFGGNFAWPTISGGCAAIVTAFLHGASGLPGWWNTFFLVGVFLLIAGLVSLMLQGARRFVGRQEVQSQALLRHRIAILQTQLDHLHNLFGHSKSAGYADAIESVFQLKIEPQVRNELSEDEQRHFYDDTGFQQPGDASRDSEVRNFIERRTIRLREVLEILRGGASSARRTTF